MGGAQSNFPLLSHSSSQHVSTRIVERRSPNSRIGRKRTVQKARHDSRFTFTPSTPKTEATSACVTPRDDIVSTLSPFEHNLNNTFQVTDITKHLELEGCRSEGSVWIGWEVRINPSSV